VNRAARYALFFVGAGCFAVLFVLAVLDMPPFGTHFHPYRDHAVSVAAKQQTANVVSSINFDQRGLDTLGEETILLGSVIGAAALLRASKEEREESEPVEAGRTLEATRLAGYLLLPVTLVIGMDLVLHGQITPGGGFQGGVVLATGLHLLYVSGRYEALEKLRPKRLFENGEALGAAAFALLGLAGIGAAGAFLGNVVPKGTLGKLFSAGTVPIYNGAVGTEVACGIVVLLAAFFEQAFLIGPQGPQRDGG
jgi:multicomponent Na+:H+ antiporter subunit B